MYLMEYRACGVVVNDLICSIDWFIRMQAGCYFDANQVRAKYYYQLVIEELKVCKDGHLQS